ncbi:phosphoglycolate phosphatase [Comamonas sp. NLF-1-9]|uniref:phosphoglycolate phosphatase n=1 Tax=Comamonas sp. NLF-1-9 TaxID=2853163 RepID=UPI001C447311|nr:phosphoglycolate phosphatase [Comamonas sp. NLF-1-9]QXL85897.1 phosphoglycolate phosphatase [Comamonas sp. NLF-1-9]
MDVTGPADAASFARGPWLAQVDAVLLDLDGTLVDTLGDFALALARTLAELDLPAMPREEIALRVGKGSEHLLQSVLLWACTRAGHADAAARAQALYTRAHLRYQHHYGLVNGSHAVLYPGVQEGLAGLRRAGLRLVCLTNKPHAHALALLRAKGLDGAFETVFGGDSFARKKPDPLPLLQACAWLGTVPARTLMVGDSRNDAQAARAAGCPVVLVTWGYNHGQPVREVDADGYMDSFAEMGVG